MGVYRVSLDYNSHGCSDECFKILDIREILSKDEDGNECLYFENLNLIGKIDIDRIFHSKDELESYLEETTDITVDELIIAD